MCVCVAQVYCVYTGEIQIICSLLTVCVFMLSTVSVCCIWADKEKNPDWFIFQYTQPTAHITLYSVPLSKISQATNDAMQRLYIFLPTKSRRALASANASIDTNLCNERPKLLQKLPAKFNLAIFRLRFCAVGILSLEIGTNVYMRASKCMSIG